MSKRLIKEMLDIMRINALSLVLLFLIVVLQIIKAYLGLHSINPSIVMINGFLFTCFAVSIVYPRKHHYEAFRKIVILGIPSVVTLIVLGMYIEPATIDALAMEDGPVENTSAAVCFLAAGIWLLFSLHSLLKQRWRFLAVSILFFSIFALIGLEEISWGQRIIGADSSEFFLANNMQGETNLHNLDTSLSEKIFYTLGIVLLVIMPFFRGKLVAVFDKLKLDWLGTFLPSSWMTLPFSVIIGLAGIVVIGWVSILFVTILSLIILIFEADRLSMDGHKWRAVGRVICAVLLIVTALTFVNFNYSAVGLRNWLGSEYLELFIEIGLLVYTMDFMFRNTKILGGIKTRTI